MVDDSTAKRPLLGTGTGTQLFLGLLWLGITVWTTYATLTTGQDGPTGALGEAAEALPGIVSTAMVTAASIASAAGSKFDRAFTRLLVGLVAGVLFGAVVAVGLRFAYGSESSSITVLAVTVGLACVVGGAAAILPNTVLESGLWAVTWVFFAFVILGVLGPQAVKMLGDGPTAQSRFIYITAIAAGLLGAVHAYRHLGTERHALIWYLLAGGLPGLILLAGEALTSTGGASLAEIVHGFSADETAVATLSSADRVRDALIVLGVGGFVAMLGGIRNNRRADKEAEEERLAEEAELARAAAEDDE